MTIAKPLSPRILILSSVPEVRMREFHPQGSILKGMVKRADRYIAQGERGKAYRLMHDAVLQLKRVNPRIGCLHRLAQAKVWNLPSDHPLKNHGRECLGLSLLHSLRRQGFGSLGDFLQVDLKSGKGWFEGTAQTADGLLPTLPEGLRPAAKALFLLVDRVSDTKQYRVKHFPQSHDIFFIFEISPRRATTLIEETKTNGAVVDTATVRKALLAAFIHCSTRKPPHRNTGIPKANLALQVFSKRTFSSDFGDGLLVEAHLGYRLREKRATDNPLPIVNQPAMTYWVLSPHTVVSFLEEVGSESA